MKSNKMAMYNTASAFNGLGKASLKLDFETKEELNDYCARMLEASNPDDDGDEPEPERGHRYLIHSVKGLNAPGDVYLITDTRSKAKKELDEIKALQKYDVQKFNKEALKDIEEGDPLLFEQLKSDLTDAAQEELTVAQSPLSKQINKIKQKYPDAVLLFNVRSYYEAFGDDAKKIADVLGVSLTKRAGQYLAGFKVRDLEKNLKKLIKAGVKVAVCEQTEQALGAVNYYVKAYYPGLGKAGDLYLVRDLRTRARKEPGEVAANKNLRFIRVADETINNFKRALFDNDFYYAHDKNPGFQHIFFVFKHDKYICEFTFFSPRKREKYNEPTLAGYWTQQKIELDIKKVYNYHRTSERDQNLQLLEDKGRQSGVVEYYKDPNKQLDYYGYITEDYYNQLRQNAFNIFYNDYLNLPISNYHTEYQNKLLTAFYTNPKAYKIRLLNSWGDSSPVNDNVRDKFIGLLNDTTVGKLASDTLYNNLSILDTRTLNPTYKILPDYSAFFDTAENRSTFAGFGLDDTKELIADICRKHYKECAKIAAHLKADTLLQSCFNLWHWLHHNIRYEYDREGREEVRTPLRVWADRRRGVDCDCLSVFAWCVLKCMGYNPAFELVAFNNKKAFSHIFVNCDGVIVDRVWFIFNQRPPLVTKREIYKVNLIENLGKLF